MVQNTPCVLGDSRPAERVWRLGFELPCTRDDSRLKALGGFISDLDSRGSHATLPSWMPSDFHTNDPLISARRKRPAIAPVEGPSMVCCSTTGPALRRRFLQRGGSIATRERRFTHVLQEKSSLYHVRGTSEDYALLIHVNNTVRPTASSHRLYTAALQASHLGLT